MKSSFLPALGLAGLAAAGNPRFAGVNIAGFDFGCGTDGTCTPGAYVQPPASQFTHFTQVDGFNAFRLPVAWQALQPQLGGTLNQTFLALYDQTVQACLASGAYCEIDIHNYARYNGAIIGQGGPTNAQFANLWTQLATKYASDSKIIFGVMNEPHDLTVSTWAGSVQAAVTAIRQAGASSQIILLPGSDYTSAGSFISDGSGPALLAVTNPDGSTTNLIFDVHKYLDSDNSGTHTSCTTNNQAAFQTLATWLRQNNRQAFLTETGGGPDDSSCLTDVCQELQTLRDNSDVYLGWLGWAAGSFDQTYTLTETPMANGQDQPLVTTCIAGCFKKDCAASTVTTSSSVPSGPSSTTSSTKPSGTGSVQKYGQCGGIGYTGPTACVGSTCTVVNPYYSQCL